MDNEIDLLIEKLVAYRKEKKYTQRALAYACKIPQSTLARIETGKTIPQMDTLLKLTKQLDLDLKLEEKKSPIPEVKRWDGLEFSTYWKNQLTAKVVVRGTKVDITRFILHPVKQIFWSDKMDIYQLSCIFEDRCWDRERTDINDILKSIGVRYYDPLEIVKKTHGVSYNDFLWFQFAGEKFQYEDMLSGRCKK